VEESALVTLLISQASLLVNIEKREELVVEQKLPPDINASPFPPLALTSIPNGSMNP